MINVAVNKNIYIYISLLTIISLSILYGSNLYQYSKSSIYLSFSSDDLSSLDNLIEVRRMILDALEKYRAGEYSNAYEIVSQAYVERYELVEPVLEDIDPELNEELEDLIRESLRELISDRADVREVEKLVLEINLKIDEAIAKVLEFNRNRGVETVTIYTTVRLEEEGLGIGSLYVYIIIILISIIAVLIFLMFKRR